MIDGRIGGSRIEAPDPSIKGLIKLRQQLLWYGRTLHRESCLYDRHLTLAMRLEDLVDEERKGFGPPPSDLSVTQKLCTYV